MPKSVSPITLTRNLRKIGGSLATTLPKEVVEILKLKIGDAVEFYTGNGEVCLRKAKMGR